MPRRREKLSKNPSSMWNDMDWKSVATEDTDLGDFEDAVFLGLEELDGNAYKYTKHSTGYSLERGNSYSSRNDGEGSQELKESSLSKKGRKSVKSLRKEAALKQQEKTSASVGAAHVDDSLIAKIEEEPLPEGEVMWGAVPLHILLTQSLIQLGFLTPTPIQSAAVPSAIKGNCDIVGAAETGSGKTLAFGLPIIDFLLKNWVAWQSYANSDDAHNPCALIIAPTRELALQITAVLKEVCASFKAKRKIEVVAIVGGMSEQKQRRLLGGRSKQPVHVIVGTPGRLCEMMQDDEIVVFQDMSRLRFLVVDEADRIMEEGHFPELHRLFSRIRDHEKIAEQGSDPGTEVRRRRLGTFEPDYVSSSARTSIEWAPHDAGEGEGEGNPQENDEGNGGEDVEIDDDDNDANEENDVEEDDDDGHVPQGGEEEEADYDVADPMEAELLELRLLNVPSFERMPTEEELEEARRSMPAVPYEVDEDEVDGDDATDAAHHHHHLGSTAAKRSKSGKKRDRKARAAMAKQGDGEGASAMGTASAGVAYRPKQRQTMLYSATAMKALLKEDKWQRRDESKGRAAKAPNGRAKGRRVKGVSSEVAEALPVQLQQLLSLVALKGNTKVVDVTGLSLAIKAQQEGKADKKRKSEAGDATQVTEEGGVDDAKATKKKAKVASKGSEGSDGSVSGEAEGAEGDEKEEAAAFEAEMAKSNVSMPKGLQQLEVRVPAEEKDVMAYYFLLQHPGRTLLFVNSIKTARRVDGLLRALGLQCRTIHAQLQQRQRLRALEAFRASAEGVLVATDVAARGLDIPQIQSVLHYDVARSPQVYIHRSGRTARAGSSGLVASMVSPEDTAHHAAICAVQGVRSLPMMRADSTVVPLLAERVHLAKKIFTQSFVLMQKNKEQSWLESSAKEAGLMMDDFLLDEMGDKASQEQQEAAGRRQVNIAKAKLKQLLETPLLSIGPRPTGPLALRGPSAAAARVPKQQQPPQGKGKKWRSARGGNGVMGRDGSGHGRRSSFVVVAK